MERLKVKVSSEAESKEAQELFFELGYRDRKNWTQKNPAHESIQAWEDGEFTFSSNHNQVPVGFKEITLQELRDMVKPKVKEYLFKYNDQYTLVELSKEDAESNPEQYIEIPDGAEILTVILGDNVFYKSGNPWEWYSEESKKWMECFDVVGLDGFQNVLWQRKKEPLKNKIATAEVARQEEKHNHYKKDVSHLNVIDPYRIADLYNLHPCAEHIMKKSLCAGNRGHKDTLRDIQDIIDTAERWKQMIEEDNNEI